jgi:hypothetical protein
MATFTWPGFEIQWFEMSVKPNFRVYANAFNASAQAIDLTGERWQVSLATAPGASSAASGGALEAFIDQLLGPVNRVSLWNLARPVPRGTLRDGAAINVVNGSAAAVSVVNGSAAAVSVVSGTPVVAAALSVGASSATLRTFSGRTVEAGDMLGIGGQLVRAKTTVTADGSGNLAIEFLPRLRAAVAAFTVVVWNRPTATFMLKGDGVPITWRPGFYEGTSADFIETP